MPNKTIPASELSEIFVLFELQSGSVHQVLLTEDQKSTLRQFVLFLFEDQIVPLWEEPLDLVVDIKG